MGGYQKSRGWLTFPKIYRLVLRTAIHTITLQLPKRSAQKLMDPNMFYNVKFTSARRLFMFPQLKSCVLNFSFLIRSDYKTGSDRSMRSSVILPVRWCRANNLDKTHRIRVQTHSATDQRRKAVEKGDPAWKSAWGTPQHHVSTCGTYRLGFPSLWISNFYFQRTWKTLLLSGGPPLEFALVI